MLFAREFSERSRYFLCGDQFINSHTVKALLSDYLKKWWQLELVTYENELWWATTMLFYMVKQYRVVAYKSIRNSLIKKIKSNLCLTNVFIHVSGCRHGLSLHTELRSDALYKILINKPLAQCAGSWKCWFILISTLSSCFRELKNQGKVQLGNPKSGRGCLQEQSLTRAFHYKV